MDIKEWLKDSPIGVDIWSQKYQYNNETLDEWFTRVSGGHPGVEKLMREKKFMFAGRILSNRGIKGTKSTYSNCYVATPPEDNIESIFDAAKKLARTYSYGGGSGIDISKLCPRGSVINNAAKNTSGAISFMELFSTTTGLIGQNGRRGALMISIDCTHPDLEEFIDLKTDLTKVTKANTSVKFSDEFMNAVVEGKDFKLSFTRPESKTTIEKTVFAPDVFKKLAKNNWSAAEPGCLFWDRIKNWNLLAYTEGFEFAGVNPCAEEPLPAGGSCLLGSINLAEFVKNPFTSAASFDYEGFKSAVVIGVSALNIVLDEGLSMHPLQEQRDSVTNWRQIGLGIMGLGDMFIKMGIVYGSSASLSLSKEIGSVLFNTAIQASATIARYTEPYPKYNAVDVMTTPYFNANATVETRNLVKKYGLRNSQILTVAPTGSIGTMLGISTGIEPNFAFSYTRKTESLNKGVDTYYTVESAIVSHYWDSVVVRSRVGLKLPSEFISAEKIHYAARIDMQSVWQHFIDASISSTVNLPNDATVQDVYRLYIYAWQKGLKGITVYRDGCDRRGILEEAKVEASVQTCPECGGDIIQEGGCRHCEKCGWSACEL